MGHPDFFVKLDFKIAVDQQTRARDRNVEALRGFRTPGARGTATPIFGQFWLNFAKSS